MPMLPKVIAYDPGLTTGLAVLDSDTSTTAGEMGVDQFIDWLWRYVPDFSVVIGERFIINEGTLRTGREGQVSIEINGVARHLCRRCNVLFVEQMASDAMSFITDDKLRRLNWYRAGMGHANDALRHLGLYAIEHKLLSATIFV